MEKGFLRQTRKVVLLNTVELFGFFFPKQLKVQGSSGVRFQQGSGDSGLVLRTPGARFKGSSKVPQNPSNGSKGSGWSGAGQV